nr:hypothetical protein [Tanacetum cinerariifolium]
RGAVAPEHGDRRAQRRRLPRTESVRPPAGGAAAQLRLWPEPAHLRLPGGRQRGAAEPPVRARRRRRRGPLWHHRPGRGAAA